MAPDLERAAGHKTDGFAFNLRAAFSDDNRPVIGTEACDGQPIPAAADAIRQLFEFRPASLSLKPRREREDPKL
jgi:hypothetical protein